MSTATETNSPKYADFPEYISFQLVRTGQLIRQNDFLLLCCFSLCALLTVIFAFIVADHWLFAFGLPTAIRWIGWGSLMIVISGALVIFFRTMAGKKVSPLYAARTLERAEQKLAYNLLSLVDNQKHERLLPTAIQNTLEKRSALALHDFNVEEAIDRQQLLHGIYGLAAIVIIGTAYSLATPKSMSESLWRILFPWASVSAPTETEIQNVTPGDVTVTSGSYVEVSAIIDGKVPEQAWLVYSTADRRIIDERIQLQETPDGLGKFSAVITGENGRGVDQPTYYQLEAGDARTKPYLISVTAAPHAQIQDIRLMPPAYTGLSERRQTIGAIDAIEGTVVKLQARTNLPVTKAWIQLYDTDDLTQQAGQLPLKISQAKSGSELAGEWILQFRDDGTYPRFYRIECETADQIRDPNPPIHAILIRPDLPPEVRLIDPKGDLERPLNTVLPMMIEARDPDFFLSGLSVVVEKQGQMLSTEFIDASGRKQIQTTHQLDLSRLPLQPGDVLQYWIEARDNREPSPNRRQTARLRIRIVEPVSPEQAEQIKQADEQRQQELADEQLTQNESTEADSAAEKTEQLEDSAQPSETEMSEDATSSEQNGAGATRQSQQGEGTEKQGKSKTNQPSADGQQKNGTADNSQQGDQQNENQKDSQQPGDQFSPDGQDDDKVLERLIEKMNEKQQEQGQTEPSESSENGAPQNGTTQNNTEQNPDPSMPNQPDSTGNSTEEMQPATNPENKLPPNPPENQQQPDPNGKQPASDNTDPSQPKMQEQPQENSEAGNTEKPTPNAENKQPGSDMPTASSNENSSENPGENTGSKPGENPSNGEKNADQPGGSNTAAKTPTDNTPPPAESGQQPGKGDQSDQNANSPAMKQDQPANQQGTKTPAKQPGQGESQQPGQGQERGPAERETNPDKKGPQAENSLETPPGAKPGSDPAQQKNSPPDPNSKPGGEKPAAGQKPGPQGQKPSEQPPGNQKSATDQQNPAQEPNQPQGSPMEEQGDQNSPANQGGQPPQGQQPGKSPAEGKGESQSAGEGQGKGESPSEGEGQGTGEGKKPGQQGTKPGQGEGKGTPGQVPAEAGQKPAKENQPGVARGGENRPSESAANQPGVGTESPPSTADSIEDRQKAANLVLDQLEQDLKRGDVDQELLDELGWTKDNLKQFQERMSEYRRSQQEGETSDLKRQQFEEMLRNMQLSGQRSAREGSASGKISRDEFVPNLTPAPPEYRDQEQAFRKSLSGAK